jgi:hypothetical protein
MEELFTKYLESACRMYDGSGYYTRSSQGHQVGLVHSNNDWVRFRTDSAIDAASISSSFSQERSM